MRRASSRGWVSLPILVLLMTVAGLSLAYQQRLQERFLLRSTLEAFNQSTQIWQAFEQAVVVSVDFSAASAAQSQCAGFCRINASAYSVNATVWRHDATEVTYLWRYYTDAESVRFYRLCARHQQQNYCWWWRHHRLISRGFVTSAD